MYLLKPGLLVALFATTVHSHMDIISPCPRYSPRGLDCPALPAGQSIEYSMSSPLGAKEPLCKHTVPFPTPSATWTAGQSVTVKFAPGGSPHGGGHCEFSLSYDGGNTFVVVYQVLRYCFGTYQNTREHTFDLPAGLPSSDKAVFAWTWVNAMGNREFYMNCADVVIKGGSAPFTGKAMTIANHQGYPSIPEFLGNYDTGLELYGKTTITVTGDGGSNIPEPKKGEQSQQPDNPDNPDNPEKPEKPEKPQKPEKSHSKTVDEGIEPTNNLEIQIVPQINQVSNNGGAFVIEFLPNGENDDVGPGKCDDNSEDDPSSASDGGSGLEITTDDVVNYPGNDKPAGRSICVLGTYRCGTKPSEFEVCDNLGWVSRSCAPGTVCLMGAMGSSPCQLA